MESPLWAPTLSSLHFLFSRLGWCGGGLVIAIVFTILDPELAKMMAPSGGATGASGPSTSVDSVPQDDIWAALDQRPQAPAPAEGTNINQGPNRNEESTSAPREGGHNPFLFERPHASDQPFEPNAQRVDYNKKRILKRISLFPTSVKVSKRRIKENEHKTTNQTFS